MYLYFNFFISFIKTILKFKNILLCVKIISDNNKGNNLNNGFYKDLDTNFEMAYELSQKKYSHSELVLMLQEGNIPQKQIAALEFDSVNTVDDAKVLLNNLTGCDGKIREAVALSINRLLQGNSDVCKIFAEISADTFADATIDINANICRLVVDSAILMKNYNIFSYNYAEKILRFTNEALGEIDKFIFRDKKYVINKQVFKLYWCLEALKYFWEFLDENDILDVLKKSAIQKEYTIREKTAQIAVISDKFSQILKLLESDENYYVRKVLN